MQPLIETMPYHDANILAQTLCQAPWAFFLDSADRQHCRAQFSTIGLDPFLSILAQPQDECPFSHLDRLLKKYQSSNIDTIGGFQGGVVGYLGYECGLAANINPNINNSHQAPTPLPKWAFACYDVVISFDHHNQSAWLISTGHPEKIPAQQLARAEKRMTWIKSLYHQALQNKSPPAIMAVSCGPISSNYSRNQYHQMVHQAQGAILRGDCFELNVTQRFQCERKSGSNMDFYQHLRHQNPAPFAGFLSLPNDQAIASASPEQFIQCHQGKVITSPIKGTITKKPDPTADKKNQQTLLDSEKDRAENVMIVDLLRNDLSKICKAESVRVSKLCDLETFATVHHLVSCIEGSLLAQHNAVDLFKHAFPGGSITGAPKIQAMKTIAALESVQRGPYCGSLFSLGFNGNLDSNLLIRTLCLDQNHLSYHAGGAITLDSDPEAEYQESMIKAKALTKAIGSTV